MKLGEAVGGSRYDNNKRAAHHKSGDRNLPAHASHQEGGGLTMPTFTNIIWTLVAILIAVALILWIHNQLTT